MSSLVRGQNSSACEISHVSPHGIWLLASTGKELFMSYDDFPWFKDQPVKVIYNVEEQSVGHYYWPDLDVDLSDEIIENPKNYPLRARHK